MGRGPARVQRDFTKLIDDFNATYPVGSSILVHTGTLQDPAVEVEVRDPAQVLGGHTPVVYVTGGKGCVALTHVVRRAA
jgi:hypothetical protein